MRGPPLSGVDPVFKSRLEPRYGFLDQEEPLRHYRRHLFRMEVPVPSDFVCSVDESVEEPLPGNLNFVLPLVFKGVTDIC